jgi:hypothetical protein
MSSSMKEKVHDFVSGLHRQVVRAQRRPAWSVPLAPLQAGLGRVKEALGGAVIETLRYRNKELLGRMHARVLSTPPLRCNPEARVEVHTLTAHHHLTMYLTAIKSLLRFHDDVAVVVHDDGSLDADDRARLRGHVPGIRLIARAVADAEMNALLAARPCSRRLRETVVNALELFDNIILARTERLVNLNSDVLFVAEPTELIAWLTEDDASIAGVWEERPAKQQEFLAAYDCPFPPHVTTALACLPRDLYDGAFVEEALARAEYDWFTAQNVYPLLYQRQAGKRAVRFFDQQRYQSSGVFPDEAVFRHYWTSTGWFTELQSRDTTQVIESLGRGAHDDGG